MSEARYEVIGSFTTEVRVAGDTPREAYEAFVKQYPEATPTWLSLEGKEGEGRSVETGCEVCRGPICEGDAYVSDGEVEWHTECPK